MGIQEAVEKEANFWAGLWGVGSKYDLDDIVPDMQNHPGPIVRDMIRKACLSFPIQTGLGPDAIQPRALLRVSNESLDALAAVLTTIEHNRDWPDFTKLVMTVLLPKSDGGLRPIRLFPTLYRVWMRCRRPTIKQWRKSNDREFRYGGLAKGHKGRRGCTWSGLSWPLKEEGSTLPSS